MNETRKRLVGLLVGLLIPVGLLLEGFVYNYTYLALAFFVYVIVLPHITGGGDSEILKLLGSAALLEIGKEIFNITPSASSTIPLIPFIAIVISGLLYYHVLSGISRRTGFGGFRIQGLLYLGAVAGWFAMVGPLLLLAWAVAVPVSHAVYYKRHTGGKKNET